MSADNYIFIDSSRFPIEVWSCVASYTTESEKTNSLNGQKCLLLGEANTLGHAIKIAEKEDSEYGISFKLWAK